jgi:hypothetical protein
MINSILGCTYAFIFACTTLYLIKSNNVKNITVRGKRVIFCFALVAGFLLQLFVTHINVDCDLRTGASATCATHWTK